MKRWIAFLGAVSGIHCHYSGRKCGDTNSPLYAGFRSRSYVASLDNAVRLRIYWRQNILAVRRIFSWSKQI